VRLLPTHEAMTHPGSPVEIRGWRE